MKYMFLVLLFCLSVGKTFSQTWDDLLHRADSLYICSTTHPADLDSAIIVGQRHLIVPSSVLAKTTLMLRGFLCVLEAIVLSMEMLTLLNNIGSGL